MSRSQASVPAEFAAVLRRLHAEDAERLDSLLLAARMNGWTLQALADPLGITRERVRQRVEMARPAGNLPPVPLPPKRPRPLPKPPPARLKLTEDLAEDLREMARIAAMVNGGTPTNHPARRVSESYTAQLAAYISQGMTAYYLASVVGVTVGAINMRLARHGYREQYPSVQKNGKYRNVQTGGGEYANTCGSDHLRGSNLRISQPSGRRVCRACVRRSSARYAERRRQTANSSST